MRLCLTAWHELVAVAGAKSPRWFIWFCKIIKAFLCASVFSKHVDWFCLTQTLVFDDDLVIFHAAVFCPSLSSLFNCKRNLARVCSLHYFGSKRRFIHNDIDLMMSERLYSLEFISFIIEMDLFGPANHQLHWRCYCCSYLIVRISFAAVSILTISVFHIHINITRIEMTRYHSL